MFTKPEKPWGVMGGPYWRIPSGILGGTAGLVCIWAVAVALFTVPVVQRHALYAHKIRTPLWWMSCNEPEQWGFAKNQVTPFFFDTPDHESLYAWHILPNGLYAQHEAELMEGPTGVAEDITRRRGFQLLQDDPNARLIISFHGNAGHVAQGWRPDLYRTLIQGSTHSFHVLAVDYRGYGYSTGSPDEKGLITDGIATVHWALNVAKIPPERIVIVGHSMGTAVTAATAEHFALQGIDFAGIIVVAPFSSMPKLLTRYTIGDLVAPLYPIEWIPWLHRRFADVIHEKWPSAERLANFMRVSTRAKLFIIGARNDYNIRYSHSDTIFAAAANATTDDMPVEVFEKLKEKSTVHTGHGGFISTWKASPEKVIQEVIFPYGGHNEILRYTPVPLAVLRAFGMAEPESLSL